MKKSKLIDYMFLLVGSMYDAKDQKKRKSYKNRVSARREAKKFFTSKIKKIIIFEKKESDWIEIEQIKNGEQHDTV